MTVTVNVCVLLMLSVGASSTALRALDVFGDINKGIQKEVVAVARPVGSGVVGVLSSQCAVVKKAFGLQYEQIKGEKEPDLHKLTLEFRDRLERVIFEILTAPIEIPKSRIYHPNETLTIFVHGFTDDPTKHGFMNISEAFQKIGYFNVLALDGSSLIRWLYLRSTTYVRFMGEKLGEVLAAMVKNGLDPKKIHMIGHSLGAHISGFTGKSFYKLTGRRIGRISGLDPAGPCFVEIDPDSRLKATDAEFVDVVHTDAGVFGLTEPVGHVDYYPNGGSKQPECIILGCGHSRSWLYYAASVGDPKVFPAVKCKDWDAFKKGDCESEISYMGYGCDSRTRGSYFLQTGASFPFGLGRNGTRFNNDEAVADKLYSAAKSLL